MTSLILVGDVNLMNVADPGRAVRGSSDRNCATADIVFANLECCLYRPPDGHAVEHEGFFADPEIAGEALQIGRHRRGRASPTTSITASAAILGSIAQLDRLGIAHTGAGADLAAARAPAIVERGGLRVGFLQRSSVYWPTNHEATRDGLRHRGDPRPHGLSGAGAQDPARDPADEPARRAADRRDLGRPRLSRRASPTTSRRCGREADIVVASCHWGLRRGGARLHDRDRACRDRCRRRHRHRARAALLAAGRGL